MAKVVLALISIMVAVAWSAALMAAPTCEQADESLEPCLNYLTGQVTEPSKVCCSDVKNLNAKAKTRDDRQAVCQCLKDAAGRVNGIIEARCKQLPGECRVKLSIPISRDVNCSTIS